MKHICNTILICIAAIILFSCNNSGKELTEHCKAMDNMCPMSLGNNLLSMNSVNYSNGEVVFTYSVNNQAFNFDAIRANETTFHNNMLSTYANNTNDSFKKLINAIIKAKANFNLIFKSTDNNDSYTCRFTYDELKSAMDKKTPNAEDKVQAIIDNTKLQLPSQVAEGITITDVAIENNCFTYYCKCDENMYSIETLQANADASKKIILESTINNNDAILKDLVATLIQSNLGMAYKYVGSKSGKTCTITIDAAELKSCVEHSKLQYRNIH